MNKRALVLFPLMIILLYLPWLGTGQNLLNGLFTYAEHWRFNDSLFSILCYLTGSILISKSIAASFLIGLLGYLTLRKKSLLKSTYLLIGTCLLLSPTLHPWYLTWIIPFLCFNPNRSWLMLSGLVGLSYHVLIDYTTKGIWQESIWIKVLEFFPFYVLLVFDWVNSWKSKGSTR